MTHTSTVEVNSQTFDRLTVGKVYLFDGRKARVLEKLAGGITLSNGIVSGRSFVRVRYF